MVLGTDRKLIQSTDSLATLLRVDAGYANNKGEIYDNNGVFIDFPRELSSKNRSNLDFSSVIKQLCNKRVACLVHERRNYSYYHWTYETLPKLIYLNKHRKELEVDKLYFHYGFLGHPYQRQAIRKLGFKFWQILDAKRISSLMAKEILVVKLHDSRFDPGAELCRTIKSAFIKRPAKETGRRIYLTRDHVKTGRKVANEAQLRALLSAYGFQAVIADNLSLSNQATLFNESKYVISPHGATLANIVFCEPGTRILELFNRMDRSAWRPVYSRIAEKCELELMPLAPKQTVLPQTVQDEDGQNDKVQHRTDFVADLSAIQAILTDWGL
ncbi:MAG: glycosyltransferase family 61 protein [Cyanobacteria bacterium P01_D01_bin.44]